MMRCYFSPPKAFFLIFMLFATSVFGRCTNLNVDTHREMVGIEVHHRKADVSFETRVKAGLAVIKRFYPRAPLLEINQNLTHQPDLIRMVFNTPKPMHPQRYIVLTEKAPSVFANPVLKIGTFMGDYVLPRQLKMSYHSAEVLRQSLGYGGLAYSVTVRHPLSLHSYHSMYIFNMAHEFVLVDSVNRKVFTEQKYSTSDQLLQANWAQTSH